MDAGGGMAASGGRSVGLFRDDDGDSAGCSCRVQCRGRGVPIKRKHLIKR